MAVFIAPLLSVLLSVQTIPPTSLQKEPLFFSRYDATKGFPQVMISSILQDKENSIWIASSAENKVIHFDGSHIDSFNIDTPEALFLDDSGKIVVSSPKSGSMFVTDAAGIKGVDVEKEIGFVPLFFQKLPDGRLFCASPGKIAVLESSCFPSRVVFRMDAPGKIKSCAMMDGLVLMGTIEGRLYSFDREVFKPSLLSVFPSEVNSILPDRHNGLWIGTRKNGLYHCPLRGALAEPFILDAQASDSGRENILCMAYQSPDKLWIGTKDGLAVYDELLGSVTVHRHSQDKANSLSHNTVRRMIRDNQGGMWLGTYYGGVNYWHPSRNRFRALRSGSTEYDLNDHIVNAIREDDDGKIWIGTNSGGINCYNPETGKIKKYRDPQSFNDVISLYPCPGSSDIIYYSNIGGLSRLDSRSGGVTRLCETPYANMILPAKEEGKILLWTLNGRCTLYSIRENKCEPAGEDEILSELPEYAVSERDRYGCIWTGTEKGLERTTPDGNKYTFHTFDGLASEFFPKNAHCRSKDGKMYFGGMGGVTIFNPSSFVEEDKCPSPRISSVILDGVTRIPFKAGEVLKLRQTKGHYFFHFSVPDFISEGKNTFSYIMEGYDTDWIAADLDNYAVYTNLPKGSYTFRLSATRSGDEGVGGNVCELKLKVIPPWYKTTLAYVLAALLVASVCAIALLHLIHQKEMENKLALHELEARHAREITRLKALRFINSSATGEPVGKVKDLTKEEENFITKVMSIVEANIDKPEFNSTLLAEKMNVSRMTLHKQMKEMTGASTLDFIHKVRFTEACRMLKESDLTVSEIAYKLGFGHPTSFTASFKKYLGCTPLEFKQTK